MFDHVLLFLHNFSTVVQGKGRDYFSEEWIDDGQWKDVVGDR